MEPFLRIECVSLGETTDDDTIHVSRKDGSFYFEGTKKDFTKLLIEQSKNDKREND